MINYIDYIETNGTQITWDSGCMIGNDINAKIYLDFMPLSGNGYGDVWYAYYSDGGNEIYLRAGGNGRDMGLAFGDNRSKIDSSGYYTSFDVRQNYLLDKNGLTDYSNNTLLVDVQSSSINSSNSLILNGESTNKRCMLARYYEFKVVNGNSEVILDMCPCLDDNDSPCFYDKVSEQYIYHSGSGTPIAGPISHILQVVPSTLLFEPSGGTSSFTVSAETGWTCTVPTAFTLSASSGDSGNTVITVSTNSANTGNTPIVETITITDDDNYAKTVKLRQKTTALTSNLFMGDYNIETLYMGDSAVTAMYMGTTMVYG